MKSIRTILGDRQTITVPRSATIVDAASVMAAHHIGALPVLEAERLVGIVTERDVLTRVVAVRRDPGRTAVSDVMSTGLIVGDVGESCDVCLARMQQAHVRHLIALQDGRLAGIVSLRDLICADLEETREELTMLNAYVHYIPAHLQATPARP